MLKTPCRRLRPVETAEEAIVAAAVAEPGFGGGSVTIPLKERVRDIASRLSAPAADIGAVRAPQSVAPSQALNAPCSLALVCVGAGAGSGRRATRR